MTSADVQEFARILLHTFALGVVVGVVLRVIGKL